MTDLVSRLRSGSKFHAKEGDIGLEAIMSEAAIEVEGLRGDVIRQAKIIDQQMGTISRLREEQKSLGQLYAHSIRERTALQKEVADWEKHYGSILDRSEGATP